MQFYPMTGMDEISVGRWHTFMRQKQADGVIVSPRPSNLDQSPSLSLASQLDGLGIR